jgi:hypothetical protein
MCSWLSTYIALDVKAYRKLLKNERYFITHINDFNLEDKRKADIVKNFSLIRKNGFSPYPEMDKKIYQSYLNRELKICRDVESKLFYISIDNKRMFFPERNIASAKTWFNFLSLEQDYDSTHRYFSNNYYFIGVIPRANEKQNDIDFGVNEGDIVIDVGAAEGNFTLSVVDKAKKVYCIESDPMWQEALKHTFAPYGSKVEIIDKHLSDINNEKNITLKSLVEQYNIPKIDFIKFDVEEYTEQVLKGAEDVLETTFVNKIALCVYHKFEDEINFSELLSDWGYSFYLADGYMVYVGDTDVKSPLIRKGVLRAYRNIDL